MSQKTAQNSPPLDAIAVASSSTEDMLVDRQAVFRRLLGYFHRGRLAAGIFFGICAGLFNAVFLLVLKSIFTIVLPSAEGDLGETQNEYRPFEDLPISTDFVIKKPELAPGYEWVFVAIVCLSIPALLLLRGVFQFLHNYCMMWLNMRVLHRLREECFTSLINQSLSFFTRVKQGELIQTVANQTRTSADAGSQLLSAFIQHPIAIVSIIVMVILMDPLYALGALVVFPLCILPVALISRKVRKAGGKEEQESESLLVTLHETFGGIRLVKAMGQEKFQTDRFNQGSLRIVKFIMRWRKAMEISSPLVEIVGSLGISIGMVYAWLTEMHPGTFMTLNLALISIYPHAKTLSRIQVQVQKCYVAAARVFGYIDAQSEVSDAPKAKLLEKAKGDIQLDNVSFSYLIDAERSKAALHDVSICFEAGKRYALVGKSGSGKSTILSLILRFYDPNEGSIKLDGHDLTQLRQNSLRNQISLVSQDTFLFHDTVANNLRYGNPQATQHEIEQAAQLAHADEFIHELEDRYETMLGDKGCNLSGGQQQRLSIARAILRNAPILLLDEATSALDSQSEKFIQAAIEELSEGKTVIAIAHRLSTILDSDEIIVLDDGRVVDQGPHTELLARCETYQHLYQLQYQDPS